MNQLAKLVILTLRQIKQQSKINNLHILYDNQSIVDNKKSTNYQNTPQLTILSKKYQKSLHIIKLYKLELLMSESKSDSIRAVGELNSSLA